MRHNTNKNLIHNKNWHHVTEARKISLSGPSVFFCWPPCSYFSISILFFSLLFPWKVPPSVNSLKSPLDQQYLMLLVCIIASPILNISCIISLHRMTKDEYEEVIKESLRLVKQQLHKYVNNYVHTYVCMYVCMYVLCSRWKTIGSLSIAFKGNFVLGVKDFLRKLSTSILYVPRFFCSKIVLLCFHPCLVSTLFTGLSLLVVNFYRKNFTSSLSSFFLAAWQQTHKAVYKVVILAYMINWTCVVAHQMAMYVCACSIRTQFCTKEWPMCV